MKSDDGMKTFLRSLALPPKWSLTAEDREKVRRAFTHTEDDRPRRTVPSASRINGFITHVDSLCEAESSLLDQPQAFDIREAREDVLKACKRTLKALKAIERGHKILWRDTTIDHMGAGSAAEDRVANFICQIVQEAWGAVVPLQKFTTTLEAYHQEEAKTVGRPPADSDHFVRCLAKIYQQHIGRKPPAYNGGPFHSAVKKILGILGLPPAYPERRIKAALK